MINRITSYLPLAALTWILLLPSLALADENTADFESALALLQEKSFAKKTEGVDGLTASGDPRTTDVLQALLAGRLFILKEDKIVVVGKKEGADYRITTVLSGEFLGAVKKRKLKKITINNRLRGQLKNAIASLNLNDRDSRVRLEAVKAMTLKLDPAAGDLLRRQLDKETDDDVRAAIETAIGILELESPDASTQLAAIQQLEGSLDPEVRHRLTTLMEDEGSPEALRTAARQGLKRIEFQIQLYGFAETLFFGLSLGSVLVLAAIGLAITFGVMGVINMAHGELIMIGAYTTYVVQLLMPDAIDISLFVAIPAAFLVSGLFGILIERGVIRFLYGRPLETLLATFGLSLVLQQLVRSIFSPLNRSVETPSWMSGSVDINPVLSLTLNRMYILAFCLMVFTALFFILKKTPLGLQVRAVSQNRAMARAMGVRSERVDALTFGLGSGIAGVAGVALSQLTNVGPNLGQAYIIDSFMVVVFGGVGNLWGTLVGGLSLGVANKVLEPWSGAVLAKILVLVFIILFIQKRPRGLFPQKGRAAEG